MISVTHLIFGLAVAYILDRRVATAMIFSVAPDFDITFSFMYPFTHRGITHTFLAAGVFTLLTYVYTEDRVSAESCALGYLSHLGLDLLTLSGMHLLFPFQGSFSLGMSSAYSLKANTAIIALSGGAMAAKKHREVFAPVLEELYGSFSAVSGHH
ncbi:MAG: metal-dependent hydrolase [Candidatus Nanohaloarchaea archaeon]